MVRENFVLQGLNHHKVISSLHRFQSMEHDLPLAFLQLQLNVLALIFFKFVLCFAFQFLLVSDEYIVL